MSETAAARILGLDVGERRVGLALSDGLGYTAQPLLTLYRTKLRDDLKSIGRVLRRHGVTEIVVGNPLYMSGRPKPAGGAGAGLRGRCARGVPVAGASVG